MSSLTEELSSTLERLDSKSAECLARLVRDAMEITRTRLVNGEPSAESAADWPAGYYETTAGSFADEPFDFPVDTPIESIPRW